METDTREVVNDIKEDSVEILSRIDESQAIVPQAETEPSLPSLTDLVVSSPAADFVFSTSPDGKLTVRRSKRFLEKEKEIDMDDSELKQTRNLFKKLINGLNSIFYSADKISRTLLNRSRKSAYEKDRVF